MAGDFIKLTRDVTTATHVQKMLNYRNVLRDAYEQGKEILAVMNHNHNGSDFAALETLYGIPTGQGQTVFDMVNGSVGSMEGNFQTADAKNLTERVG